MPTPFDTLLAMSDRIIAATASETVVIHPQLRSPNGQPTPDPDRPVIHGRGIFELRAGKAGGVQIGNRSHNRRRNDFRSISSAPAPRVSIAEHDLDGLAVRQGDRVDLVDRFPPRRFDVVSVQPDGHGFVQIDLVEV